MADESTELQNDASRPDATSGEQQHSSSDPQRPGEWRDVLAPDIINRYYGQHIAIVHKRVVAAGASYEEVLHQAEEAYPSEMPYIAYIPKPKK